MADKTPIEAKDTIVEKYRDEKDGSIIDISDHCGIVYEMVNNQAKISFKAGIEKERERIIIWVNELCPHVETAAEPQLLKYGCPKCWQALKEGKDV